MKLEKEVGIVFESLECQAGEVCTLAYVDLINFKLIEIQTIM